MNAIASTSTWSPPESSIDGCLESWIHSEVRLGKSWTLSGGQEISEVSGEIRHSGQETALIQLANSLPSLILKSKKWNLTSPLSWCTTCVSVTTSVTLSLSELLSYPSLSYSYGSFTDQRPQPAHFVQPSFTIDNEQFKFSHIPREIIYGSRILEFQLNSSQTSVRKSRGCLVYRNRLGFLG